MARWLQAFSTRACLQVFNNCHSARRLLHGEKLLGIISTKGKMSKRFKCNVYTKCYCFLKFRSAAAQNLCDSLHPKVHPTHTAMQSKFPTSEPHFSSLQEWCQQCWELEKSVSSSVPPYPARGTFLPAVLSTDHGPVGSCPICLHHLHHCSDLLSCFLPSLLGFTSSHPITVPSSSVLHINPPVPAMSYVTYTAFLLPSSH